MAISKLFPVRAIKNWDALEQMINYILQETFRVEPNLHPLVFPDSIMSTQSERETLVKFCFERINAPAVMLLDKNVLALFSTGKVTGIIVNIEENFTEIVPIKDARPIVEAMVSLKLGGKTITETLEKLLGKKGMGFTTRLEKRSLKDIKEKLCYVSLNFDEEVKMEEKPETIEKIYETPFGEIITLNAERFIAPEILFTPSIGEINEKSLTEAILQAVNRCGEELRKEIVKAVVVSGETSALPGLKERLLKELKRLLPRNYKAKILAPAESQHAEWVGASILTSIRTSNRLWITEKAFEEKGDSIIEEKRFQTIMSTPPDSETEKIAETFEAPIILDIGANITKAGFSGESRPRIVMPTLIGYPKIETMLPEMEKIQKDYYVGEEAIELEHVLKIEHPINNIFVPIKIGAEPSLEEVETAIPETTPRIIMPLLSTSEDTDKLKEQMKTLSKDLTKALSMISEERIVWQPKEEILEIGEEEKLEEAPAEEIGEVVEKEEVMEVVEEEAEIVEEEVPEEEIMVVEKVEEEEEEVITTPSMVEEGVELEAIGEKFGKMMKQNVEIIYWQRMAIKEEYEIRIFIRMHSEALEIEKIDPEIVSEGIIKVMLTCTALKIMPSGLKIRINDILERGEKKVKFQAKPLALGDFRLNIEFSLEVGSEEVSLGKVVERIFIQKKPIVMFLRNTKHEMPKYAPLLSLILSTVLIAASVFFSMEEGTIGLIGTAVSGVFAALFILVFILLTKKSIKPYRKTAYLT
ncbi:MAG: hypothetical protein ACFE68_03620 [Candidatus Hodarchaeota archaeon]